MRVSTREKNPSAEGGRALLVALFVVYLVLLAWIVLWKLEIPHIGGGALREIKLIPFAPAGGAGASKPVEVVANLALFVPFGLYLGLLAPTWTAWKAAGATAVASLLLEVAQYVMAVGRSDVTDVVVNTAGGLIGVGFLALAHRWLQARTAAVMTRVCSIGTVLGLLASGIFIASPVRFTQPRDDAAVSTHSVPVPHAALASTRPQ